METVETAQFEDYVDVDVFLADGTLQRIFLFPSSTVVRLPRVLISHYI
jgi:hypothetical protein